MSLLLVAMPGAPSSFLFLVAQGDFLVPLVNPEGKDFSSCKFGSFASLGQVPRQQI